MMETQTNKGKYHNPSASKPRKVDEENPELGGKDKSRYSSH
jgi:hypothetical protein